MRRGVLILFALSLAAVLSGIVAVPAQAGSGGSVGASCGASSCQVQLRDLITFSGSYSAGTSNTVVDVAPPPCLWEPIGNATVGSQYIISQFGPSTTDTLFGVGNSVKQAEGLVKNPVPGEWYELPVNPADTTAEAEECAKEPLFYWVTPGNSPPGVKVPAKTLAQLAFAGLNAPTVSSITTNPATASEVNLPTYVQVAIGPSATGQLEVSDGRPYVSVTATLDGVSATVWVEASALVINPGAGSGDATTYDAADCSTARNVNGTYMLGSHASAATMAQTGAGQTIDCGVTYQAPGTYTLSASVGWTACWAATADAADVPTYAECQDTPVPGAGNLAPGNATKAITVQEIQSVNGG